MPDNDFNTIKPVESLQNIEALHPAKRREERKKRQNAQNQNEQEPEQESENLTDEETGYNETIENQQDEPGIDYCA